MENSKPSFFDKCFELFIWYVIYIGVSMILYPILGDHDNFISILAIGISIGFLFLWFYFGYTNRLGFLKGLLMGFISAIPPIILVLISLSAFIYDKEGLDLIIIYFFATPFLYLFDYIPYFGMATHFLGHISVIVVIFMTGIGGYVGKIKNKK